MHYLFWDVTQGEYKDTWLLNPPYLRSKAYLSQHANLWPFVWLKPATVCHIILFDVLGLIGTISRALNVYFIATLNVIFSPSSLWKGRSSASSEQSCEARHISITYLLQTMSRHKRERGWNPSKEDLFCSAFLIYCWTEPLLLECASPQCLHKDDKTLCIRHERSWTRFKVFVRRRLSLTAGSLCFLHLLCCVGDIV